MAKGTFEQITKVVKDGCIRSKGGMIMCIKQNNKSTCTFVLGNIRGTQISLSLFCDMFVLEIEPTVLKEERRSWQSFLLKGDKDASDLLKPEYVTCHI